MIDAEMEADVRIAFQENVHVISTDSDYLMHRNVVALHRLQLGVRSRKVSIVSTYRRAVLRKLNLSSDKLITLGIVSMNDYDPNVRGNTIH